MDKDKLIALLQAVRDGKESVQQACDKLANFPSEHLGFATLDTHRSVRTGFPEVIFCPGKTPHQVAEIFARLAARHGRVLATRATHEQYLAVRSRTAGASWNEVARAIYLRPHSPDSDPPGVLVATGGTSDIPVAEEAVITAELMGNRVERLFDVGVAGLHRLLMKSEALQRARVIVVVAGMEGALASVVGGLVSVPVIAVPTSVGYGAGFDGIAPLLAMLNSCAPGVSVVNIDNGFGAGYIAGMINRAIAAEAE